MCEPQSDSTALTYLGAVGSETSKILIPSHDDFTVTGEVVDAHELSERELSVEHVPEGNGVSDRTDDLLLSWIVADAVMKLSPEHRAVLLECYYRGASVAEAARRLDIPTGTVKSRSHYALRALALALEEMGVSP